MSYKSFPEDTSGVVYTDTRTIMLLEEYGPVRHVTAHLGFVRRGIPMST
jgi:hypothetical protein